MDTAVEQKVEGKKLEEARAKLAEAQARTKTQRDAVLRCKEELEAKRGLRDKTQKEYDRCALGEDEPGAKACLDEISDLNFAIRGAELRLNQAEEELQRVREVEGFASTEACRLIHEQKLVEEREEVTRRIDEAEQSFLRQQEGLKDFADQMEKLRQGPFLDPANQKRVNDAHFRLSSLFNGYAWYKPPLPKNKSC